MATSGTVSNTTFNTLRVVDNAFRRCRLPVQAVTAEMHDYAKDTLYLFLSELANYRTPSWCIVKSMEPLVQHVPQVSLPQGTVEVLNVNLRYASEIEASFFSQDVSEFVIAFYNSIDEIYFVTPRLVRWGFSVLPTTATFQISEDNITWVTVGTITPTEGTHWTEIAIPATGGYFRVISTDPFTVSALAVYNNPTEIPLGSVNRDTFSSFPNKFSEGRPVNYWFQRNTEPVLNLWPTPDSSSSLNQHLIVWSHRHIMDVGELAGDIEVPQRWMEAIISGLAQRLAEQTPQVDIQILGILSQRAAMAIAAAWDGDNDGSPTFYQPNISAYTR